ncbi:MAG: hypothetical protein LIR50_21785 [Bacillota bacterium]|nr:hypothetical protein [Bacillota bacterium]
MIRFENGSKFKYEHMDLAALLTLINVLAIILTTKGAYVGLSVAAGGLIYDLHKGCHINNIIIRLSLIAMNIYFLTL